MDFLQSHGFNAIRLLFAHEYVWANGIVDAPEEEPLLFQVRYLEMFAIIAREAARRGILVMVACHRIKHDAWPGAGLWYDERLGWPVSRVKRSWAHRMPHTASHMCVGAGPGPFGSTRRAEPAPRGGQRAQTTRHRHAKLAP